MHLMYAQQHILDDTVPEEREHGIKCGLLWTTRAELVAVYTDMGISEGMQRAINQATERNTPLEYRKGVWTGQIL